MKSAFSKPAFVVETRKARLNKITINLAGGNVKVMAFGLTRILFCYFPLVLLNCLQQNWRDILFEVKVHALLGNRQELAAVIMMRLAKT